MMNLLKFGVFSALSLCVTTLAVAGEAEEYLKFSELNPLQIQRVFADSARKNMVVEFAVGDHIPLSLAWKGDIFALNGTAGNLEFVVKTPFRVRFAEDTEPTVSFDFTHYLSLKEAFSGAFAFGVSTPSPDIINSQAGLITFSGELNKKKSLSPAAN